MAEAPPPPSAELDAPPPAVEVLTAQEPVPIPIPNSVPGSMEDIEKSGGREAQTGQGKGIDHRGAADKLPLPLARQLGQVDGVLLRLQSLLSTSAGLETFLSTLNYTLYILSFASSRSAKSSPSSSHALSPRWPAALASLISETRTTLRLTGLINLYALLRKLARSGGKDKDPLSYRIELLQCLSYIVFQGAENIAFLADKKVVSRKWIDSWGGSGKFYLWSSRAWLAGVSCDVAGLVRGAVVERERRRVRKLAELGDEQERKRRRLFDEAWYAKLLIAGCWIPVCAHYSLKGGLKGVNPGVVGVLGFLAGQGGMREGWERVGKGLK